MRKAGQTAGGHIIYSLDMPLHPSLIRTIRDTPNLAWAFCGKGSPYDIEMALALAVTYDAVRHPPAMPIRARRGLPTLQEFCDQYIGVDCLGLVSNFVGLKDHGRYFDIFETDDGSAPTRRKDVAEVQPYDVLLSGEGKKIHHIAVLDRWEPP